MSSLFRILALHQFRRILSPLSENKRNVVGRITYSDYNHYKLPLTKKLDLL